MTEGKDTRLKNRFYLFGQHVGHELQSSDAPDPALRILGDRNPETTLLQAQLYLVGNQELFQELMKAAREGAQNPFDTSASLYLDELNEMEMRQWKVFVAAHGESGFAAEVARNQILSNLESGSLAMKGEYAKFYIHRYTLGLESQSDLLATLERLGGVASDFREKQFWSLLRLIVNSCEQPTKRDELR